MSNIDNNIATMSTGEIAARVQELTNRKAALESELNSVNQELKAHASNLKGQLAALNKLVGNNTKGTPGRPRGPRRKNPDEPTVTDRVLELIKAHPEGMQRADILVEFPDQSAAVHGAIRTHQQKGRIINKDRLWFYDPEGAQTGDEQASDERAGEASNIEIPNGPFVDENGESSELDVLPAE